jgi:hypothetical protein
MSADIVAARLVGAPKPAWLHRLAWGSFAARASDAARPAAKAVQGWMLVTGATHEHRYQLGIARKEVKKPSCADSTALRNETPWRYRM